MNIQEMMKQAKKMQQEIANKQDKLNSTEFTFEKQGVKLVVLGNRQIKSIEINEVLVDPDDKEMLEDIIILTINEAIKELDKKHDELMPKGMGI
ncbi:YbaB/EbfC family nucleoid-associated protein [Mesomycoplasma lagogenitalium]|uniref:Nucleoid-associated protein QEG99_02465 n=1 Tax=Mesomycoplasma lagogenitalium TaxID=171286 RepID=A0ABY8LST0_9BACT|nr:YbaB/EbfC family nucleoid-associated protein [Mesomycoplasma lagogenitalium]WGI36319.1 YbaB/EbfC family nucleoid-associated protein [Mesomycoplasma lagogenitalium]